MAITNTNTLTSTAYPQYTPGTTTPTSGTGTNAYANMEGVMPGLSNLGGQASQNILSELQGELSPGTVNAIQDESARFGLGAGISGSTLSGSRGLSRLGLTTEQMQGQGLQDYLNTLKGYSGTLTPTTGEDIQQGIAQDQLGEQAREYNLGNATQYANLQLQGLEGLNNQNTQSQSYLDFIQNLM